MRKLGESNARTRDRSVVITKNGRPCAVLFPVTNETDLESLLLVQNKDFWRMFDRAHKEGEKKGFTSLDEVPDRCWDRLAALASFFLLPFYFFLGCKAAGIQ